MFREPSNQGKYGRVAPSTVAHGSRTAVRERSWFWNGRRIPNSQHRYSDWRYAAPQPLGLSPDNMPERRTWEKTRGRANSRRRQLSSVMFDTARRAVARDGARLAAVGGRRAGVPNKTQNGGRRSTGRSAPASYPDAGRSWAFRNEVEARGPEAPGRGRLSVNGRPGNMHGLRANTATEELYCFMT